MVDDELQLLILMTEVGSLLSGKRDHSQVLEAVAEIPMCVLAQQPGLLDFLVDNSHWESSRSSGSVHSHLNSTVSNTLATTTYTSYAYYQT